MIKLRPESFAKQHKCYVGVNNNGTVVASFEPVIMFQGRWLVEEGCCLRCDRVIDVTDYVVKQEADKLGICYDKNGGNQ